MLPINLQAWINEHRALLQPPVCNKLVFPVNDFYIMVVGGPNTRKDYHVEQGAEFFYQLEGDMVLNTIQEGKMVPIPIRQGEIFLLPPLVPHSPQRAAHTVGLVIERCRKEGERDGLQWYCDQCSTLLYEEYFFLRNIETDFPPVFKRFYDNTSLHSCKKCGAVLPVPEQ